MGRKRRACFEFRLFLLLVALSPPPSLPLSPRRASSPTSRKARLRKRRIQSPLAYVAWPPTIMTRNSRRWRRASNSFLALAFLLQHAALPAHAALSKVDFDRMGHVGLAGTFAGLDLFNSSTVSFDPSTSTLLSRAADGSLTRLGSTEAGEKINAGCALGDTIFVAGSFSSINGTSANNVASFSSSAFHALGSNGPSGEVKVIFCDDSNKKVWVGGTFSSPGVCLCGRSQ